MISRTLSLQLFAALKKCGPSSSALWESFPDILCWIFFLGALVSEGQPQNQWFDVLIRYGMKKMGHVRDWEGLEVVFKRFLYVERVFGEGFREVWRRVVMEAK